MTQINTMPSPENVIETPHLNEFDVNNINECLGNISVELTKAQGKPVLFQTHSLNMSKKVFVYPEFLEIVKRQLEISGWEIKEIVRWFNWDEWDFAFIRCRYWMVSPSIDYRLKTFEKARHEFHSREQTESINGTPQNKVMA
jgi:hypothetical protein